MNPHLQPSIRPVDPVLCLWRNRRLVLDLVRREVIGRYRGSIIGLAWSVLNPLVMLLVYTFFFAVVFKARWGSGADESKADFAIVLLVGLIVHGLFSECVNRAPGLLLNNANYVKKVIFPLEILPWVGLGSALFHAVLNVLVVLVAQLLINRALPWTVPLFPLALLPLVLVSMGFAWLLASLGVYVRDIGHTTTVATSVLLFLSPVFYPVTALPEAYRGWMQLNPLTFIIETARGLLLFGRLPDWSVWTLHVAASALIAWAGFWWFQKTRKGFADVL